MPVRSVARQAAPHFRTSIGSLPRARIATPL
jgi:hypothetical protein